MTPDDGQQRAMRRGGAAAIDAVNHRERLRAIIRSSCRRSGERDLRSLPHTSTHNNDIATTVRTQAFAGYGATYSAHHVTVLSSASRNGGCA